jgi:hypothetical protein
MKALISPNEKVIDINGNVGERIAQVEPITFEVSAPLFWNDCPEDCLADLWFYFNNQCIPLPTELLPTE